MLRRISPNEAILSAFFALARDSLTRGKALVSSICANHSIAGDAAARFPDTFMRSAYSGVAGDLVRFKFSNRVGVCAAQARICGKGDRHWRSRLEGMNDEDGKDRDDEQERTGMAGLGNDGSRRGGAIRNNGDEQQ